MCIKVIQISQDLTINALIRFAISGVIGYRVPMQKGKHSLRHPISKSRVYSLPVFDAKIWQPDI